MQTFAPPPDCPMMVTLPASPPKLVVANPFEGRHNVQHAYISGRGESFAAHAGKIAETQRTQAVVDGAKDNVPQPGEVLAVVTVLFDPVAVAEPPPWIQNSTGLFLPSLVAGVKTLMRRQSSLTSS